MIDRQKFSDQPVKKDIKTYANIWNIANGQGDDCTTYCLLDYSYFKNHDKTIAIALSKLQALDADPKAIQQVNFTGNLDWGGNPTIFFIITEAMEIKLDFLKRTVKVWWCFLLQYNINLK